MMGGFRLYPEDREAEDQQDQEDHDKDIEQKAGNLGRRGRYVGEAEDAGDDRHQKEDQAPISGLSSLAPSVPSVLAPRDWRRMRNRRSNFERWSWFRSWMRRSSFCSPPVGRSQLLADFSGGPRPGSELARLVAR